MRLIDADELLKQIDLDSDGSPGWYGDTWAFMDTINNAPTIEPCEDAISREDAIKQIVNTPTLNQNKGQEYLEGSATRQNEIIDILKSLPSVAPSRPSGEWIPVKERKPSMSWDRNLVSLVRKDGQDVEEAVRTSYYFKATEFLEETWSDIPMGYEVVAWMPLPEPYKESE